MNQSIHSYLGNLKVKFITLLQKNPQMEDNIFFSSTTEAPDKKLTNTADGIDVIRIKQILNEEGIEGVFNRLNPNERVIFLRSAEDHPYGKESLLVWNPLCIIKAFSDRLCIQSKSESVETENETIWSFLPEFLQEIKNQLQKEDPQLDLAFPTELSNYVGAYGFISFEAGRQLETYVTRQDAEMVPSGYYIVPLCYLIERKNDWICIELEGESLIGESFTDFIAGLHLDHEKIAFQEELKNPHINLTYQEYISRIKTLKEHIIQGDIYQANFTMQFQIEKPNYDPRTVFNYLFQQHPTPYAAFMDCGEGLQVLSLSPELFLEIHDGVVITRPIKGTMPRGNTPEEDKTFETILNQSKKDHAELAMIVDLLRNDLSRSCKIPSVKVIEHAKLETFSNVHHLITTIEANIDESIETSWNLFLRAFPGGSITGCPKLRALEIIEELETVPRGIYTGSIGLLSIAGELRQNIAIRTIQAIGDKYIYNAGGGITYDSNPQEEYIECLNKAIHITESLGATFIGHLIWYNGKIITKEEAQTIAFYEKCRTFSTNGIQGCFETILLKNGQIEHLQMHLNRLCKGINYFGFKLKVPSPNEILNYCRINTANNARLKILVGVDHESSDSSLHIIMDIQPYHQDNSPIRLGLFPDAVNPPRDIKTAGIKTLEYTLYHKATQLALKHQLWDLLLYDSTNQFLETGRSNIYFYFVQEQEWRTPPKNVVHGTIRQILINSKKVKCKPIFKTDMAQIGAIAVSNALNGVREVKELQETVWNVTKDHLIATPIWQSAIDSENIVKLLQDLISQRVYKEKKIPIL